MSLNFHSHEQTVEVTDASTNNQNHIKNYFYQESEVPFKSELIFEGLNLVNELLPRVEEENEEDLDADDGDEDDDDEITAKEVLSGKMVDKTLNSEEDTYHKLIELEEANCVANKEAFQCPICFVEFNPGEGVILRDCLHVFCR